MAKAAAQGTAVVAPVAKNEVTTKRFVIRKTLVGQKAVITFLNHKKQKCTYDHDEVYTKFKARFDLMNCFAKYGSYTNSKNVPGFVRNVEGLAKIV